jgi:hypothetical protein
VEVKVLINKGGDEEVGVVVPRLHARLQLQLALGRALQRPGVQLCLQELVVGACSGRESQGFGGLGKGAGLGEGLGLGKGNGLPGPVSGCREMLPFLEDQGW